MILESEVVSFCSGCCTAGVLGLDAHGLCTLERGIYEPCRIWAGYVYGVAGGRIEKVPVHPARSFYKGVSPEDMVSGTS